MLEYFCKESMRKAGGRVYHAIYARFINAVVIS